MEKRQSNTKEDIKKINKIILKHEGKSGVLIPVLQEAQEIFGYLPEHVLQAVAKGLNIPPSTVYGVVTFYTQFYLTRRGRNLIKCCLGTACYVKGGKKIIDTIRKELKLKENEDTTADYKFTLETARCIGTCFLAPVILINNDYYGNLSPKEIPGILQLYS